MLARLSLLLSLFFCCPLFIPAQTEHSVAREWNELLLEGIRGDFARPTVHARNLFHTSAAMYDAWAVYDSTANTYLLGDTLRGFECPYDPNTLPFLNDTILATAQHMAISYAAYRILSHRFSDSPGAPNLIPRLDAFMADSLGYLIGYTNADYTNGNPAAMGNYIAQCYINYGLQDGANEENDYENNYYEPVNEPLVMELAGNPDVLDPNRWQPLTLEVFIDQSGNVTSGDTPDFLSPEWGIVYPFALKNEDLNIYQRDSNDYWVYHDPGPPPYLSDSPDDLAAEYQWGFSLVSTWSSHLDPGDGVMWDISPAAIGNLQVEDYPTDIEGLRDFYDLAEGGDPSSGHTVNPHTGIPYEPNLVPRGDYARVLAEFWADGPDSETPPGHWFTILNYVNDHPELVRKFRGIGIEMDSLEWDIKTYMALGGAMHDAAITAWGIKGYYDYIRPVSAIRHMADLGQSTDPMEPSFHPEGIPLYPGLIELVYAGDPLEGEMGENIGKIKLFAWKGPDYINFPQIDVAGVDWILAENWWPYQRPSFVTPPFAGYVSGHSTYSRAAAEILTMITGDPFFPGGMGVFDAPANQFLVFEDGPSIDIELQWATYRDASDQCSLSRIWGGIHPPADDIPGRLAGIEIGIDAFELAESLFYQDADMDGFYSYEDCDDSNAGIHPDAVEICDGIDNNCDGFIDEALTVYTYYRDNDGDGFGVDTISIDTCLLAAPAGYALVANDCDDNNPEVNPDAEEICDNLDNNCSGLINDGLEILTYYRDQDMDGFGDEGQALDTCLAFAPEGFTSIGGDCNDSNENIHPNAVEVCDSLDNNCNGFINDSIPVFTYYLDNDNDSYGDAGVFLDTCMMTPPAGYVLNAMDCNDQDSSIHPLAIELCDTLDNNCDGFINEGLENFTYYQDSDGDGFGNSESVIDTCVVSAPDNYVTNAEDCDDENAAINPDMMEIADNGIDEDCDGEDLISNTNDIQATAIHIYPNPTTGDLNIQLDYSGEMRIKLYAASGTLVMDKSLPFINDGAIIPLSLLPKGIYFLKLFDHQEKVIGISRVAKW